ncbi:MAG: hypothetical protein IJ992_07260 [Lentisphaeria bacterium]|nr:hypothetical protein [Lentisphaeria bacterium]
MADPLVMKKSFSRDRVSSMRAGSFNFTWAVRAFSVVLIAQNSCAAETRVHPFPTVSYLACSPQHHGKVELTFFFTYG